MGVATLTKLDIKMSKERYGARAQRKKYSGTNTLTTLKPYWYKAYGISMAQMPCNWEGTVHAIDDEEALVCADKKSWQWVCDHVKTILIYEMTDGVIDATPCRTRSYPKKAVPVSLLSQPCDKPTPTVIYASQYLSPSQNWETAKWLDKEVKIKRYKTTKFKEAEL